MQDFTPPNRVHARLGRLLWPTLLLWLGLALPAPAATPATLGPQDLIEQALRYLHGEGVAPDPDRAVLYLCAAAQDGHAAAAYELGWLYLNARGVGRDDALGAAWLREAARLGETAATGALQRLGAVDHKPLWCVGSDGLPLQLDGSDRKALKTAIRLLAPRYGLDPDLVVEVVRAESDFNPRARSPKGALGLMQLIPTTAARFGVADPLEPAQNLRGGMAYLRWLLARFDGDVKLTLAGYNAGEAAVERHGGVPPYAETRAYVQRILARYGKQHHPVPAQAL